MRRRVIELSAAQMVAGARLVVCIGTVEARKAQIPLAIAFDLIGARHPDSHLAFVGGREGAWETVAGVGTDDQVTVTVSSSEGSWTIPTIVIPPPLTSILPMRLLIAISIFLAAGVAWWAAGRTSRAWRRPLPEHGLR